MEQRIEPYALYFADEMWYGLISNFRRSWSKVGERTVIDSQQSFDNRYLFSAVSPITGDSFHIRSIAGFDSNAAYVFLTELKKQHLHETVILVWDNAPCHRPKIHREIEGLIIIFLPPYSPELNPAERFFEELRKSTANQIFKTIADQEVAIEQKLNELTNDTDAMKQLLGYDWILRQTGGFSWGWYYCARSFDHTPNSIQLHIFCWLLVVHNLSVSSFALYEFVF